MFIANAINQDVEQDVCAWLIDQQSPHAEITGSWSDLGKLALTSTMTPNPLVAVAVSPLRETATRESRSAVVRSSAILGRMRPVAVNPKDGAIT